MHTSQNPSGSPAKPRCVAIIVAAGRGSRVGGDLPKQYIPIGGEPVIRRTLRAFSSHSLVDAVLPVIHMDDVDLFREAAQDIETLPPVSGGETRQDSVRAGLEHLEQISPSTDYVLIHDAARAFVSECLISSVVEALANHEGAIPALRVVDTLKRENSEGLIEETVEREALWRAQTPQGFRFLDILAAHRTFAGESLTDDSALAEQAGLAVALVPGEESNVKITTSEDINAANEKLAQGDPRMGQGFDVHRFCDGDGVTLCGVNIPHTQGLEGHSDADVAMHALTDALLGALADGDIGAHFPPTDERWRGAASDIFLKFAAERVAGRGGRIVNVDVTIVCESPKIGPHRAAMTERLAGVLGVAENRVSVKATTTEKLGFTGRGEGIAAQAVATIILP